MTKPYIIGIAGGSAIGKSYFLNRIRELFAESQVCVISQDDYYRPIEMQKKDSKGFENYDLPEAIDHEAFVADILHLQSGQNITRLRYNFNNEAQAPEHYTLVPSKIVLVEGLFIMHIAKIREIIDLKLFLDTRDDIKLLRRLKRDEIDRGISRDTIMHQWNEHVYPSYKQYLLPYKDDADLIITNNINMEKALEVITDHIRHKLQSAQ